MTLWTAETEYACGWTMDDDCATCKKNLTDDNKALFQRCVNSAAEILYSLSGRQFGLCELTVRPCRRDECPPTGSGLRWTPVLSGGEWTNVSCSSCYRGCSCTRVCDVVLPGPVEEVLQVRQDGIILPPELWRVDNRRSLVRLPGQPEEATLSECWPTCQEMSLPASEPGTWEVKYLRGRPVPEAGRAAMAELACELGYACLGDPCCKLPKRITSITRDGATMAILDPMTFIDKGLTGLYNVDLWLRSVNPKARSRSAAVLSPDMPRFRRTTQES